MCIHKVTILEINILWYDLKSHKYLIELILSFLLLSAATWNHLLEVIIVKTCYQLYNKRTKILLVD